MNSSIQKTWISNTFPRVLIILISSVVLTIIVSNLLPSSLPLLLPEGKRPAILNGALNNMLYVDVRVANEEISKGNSFLVDVRDKEDYLNLHPAHAINIPYHESGNVYDELAEKVNVDKRIFILCEGALCEMSVRVANRLIAMGYKNTGIIKQDFEEWKKLNLPTEKGKTENGNDDAK